jgi:hypothetical protein
MKKSILITESQYSNLVGKINEQEASNLLFKSNYLPDQKKIQASYYLLSEKPNSFSVVNPKEFIRKDIEWADGSQDYRLNFDIVELPKSQVEVVGEVDGNPEYKIFEIPYWLYKKEPKLEIRRFQGKKRPTLSGQHDMLKQISDLGIIDAFKALGGDFGKLERYINTIQNPIKPKPYEQPERSTDTFGQSYGRPYWGD